MKNKNLFEQNNNKLKFEIFTDAASFNNGCKDPNLPQHSSSAGVMLFDSKVIAGFKSFNPNTTNNFGELYAIYLSLKNAYELLKGIKGLKPPYNINLVSDSKICVCGLNEWIYSWKKKVDKNNVWYSSTGPVMNQELFKAIDVEFLQNPELNLNIFHIRGHVTNDTKFKKALVTFKNINHINIEESLMRYFCYMNNLCDSYAKVILQKGIFEYNVLIDKQLDKYDENTLNEGMYKIWRGDKE